MALSLFTNTYLLDAEPYLSGIADWDSSSDEEKEQALVSATRLLDTTLWAGQAVSASQPLAWPRTTFYFFDPVLNLDVTVLTGETPVRLDKAVAAQALHILRYPQLEREFQQSFDSISVGPISLSNSSSVKGAKEVPKVPAEVYDLLRPLSSQASTNNWWRTN